MGLAAFLSGCWAPPSADVHPRGHPGVVAGGIEVERAAGPGATLEVLTVYIPPAALTHAGMRSGPPDARVLAVDPSYRLLTVVYPGGATETFKVGLHTRLRGIEPGDWVAIRPGVEHRDLRRHPPSAAAR